MLTWLSDLVKGLLGAAIHLCLIDPDAMRQALLGRRNRPLERTIPSSLLDS